MAPAGPLVRLAFALAAGVLLPAESVRKLVAYLRSLKPAGDPFAATAW
ncbi:MAG TPA: hypothetical protein VFT84_02790 [Gemmatimonadales bacterium]|nr:hypothetical protein [Gemmatimonadales bacterium]